MACTFHCNINDLGAFFEHANLSLTEGLTLFLTPLVITKGCKKNGQCHEAAAKNQRRRGDTPPSRSHPAACGLPSPPGALPLGLRPHPLSSSAFGAEDYKTRRKRLEQPISSYLRCAMPKGATPLWTPRNSISTTTAAILGRKWCIEGSRFYARKEKSQATAPANTRPSSVNEKYGKTC